ncbi:class I SAM-dependent methyltransferase [Corynebacterium felinum]|uniref:Ubiquinone/menaquinone biosynthesis C-methylase UbiE n=1 Tax=Corynebacterium felinum TaxID=131318 RepID=A0ABU2BA94_9CORY|nr:class I SAM-dependent methyltransferase [Corynebacterium felinum]MDF5819717.1 class I SAM-dependent methyltransferase [Corynebacterium felinum]MDR7355565.1 ubiquinone/menaquinone biosynthesis C-methylase UbiE [Corynebacterium felinum]WJY94915.1 ubiquinone/menaquinone biosynthesis methyltransferase [Corynebacterium felinum]
MRKESTPQAAQLGVDLSHIEADAINASSPSHIPRVSQRNVPKFADSTHRGISATAFHTGAENYHDIRPSYPQDVLSLLSPARKVLDIGAGTGKLTILLATHPNFEQVYALDPSKDMVATLRTHLPQVPAWQATAEHTACAHSLFDAVTIAQTWHWVDPTAASIELDRITTDTAEVLLVWNTLDVSIPWVHRLSRIMHSGDTLKEGFLPQIDTPWRIDKILRSTWQQSITPEEIHRLTHTRSYWLRSNEKTRAKVTQNLNWYLYDHLNLKPNVAVQLPYRVDGFVLKKS